MKHVFSTMSIADFPVCQKLHENLNCIVPETTHKYMPAMHIGQKRGKRHNNLGFSISSTGFKTTIRFGPLPQKSNQSKSHPLERPGTNHNYLKHDVNNSQIESETQCFDFQSLALSRGIEMDNGYERTQSSQGSLCLLFSIYALPVNGETRSTRTASSTLAGSGTVY